jgi:DNA-binding transcriptional regulator YiaG
MKKAKQKQTCDGMQIIEQRFLRNDTALKEMVDQEFDKLQIGQQIYELRKAEKLTQEQLAHLIGTTGSVISRLESAEYDGHSLKMLERIAVALGKKIDVKIVDRGKQSA